MHGSILFINGLIQAIQVTREQRVNPNAKDSSNSTNKPPQKASLLAANSRVQMNQQEEQRVDNPVKLPQWKCG